MDEQSYRRLLAEFLDGYWAAFHEALEAQSVTPTRLAGSLFEDLEAAHLRFAKLYQNEAADALAALDRTWSALRARRAIQPDPPFHADEVAQAHEQFRVIYRQLKKQGARFPKVAAHVEKAAAHGTPLSPLRADAAF